MNTMVITHGGYLVLGIAATIWVVWTLRQSGLPFLVRWCGGNEQLAASWNHLLAVGIYLLHIGCLLLALRYGGQATTEVAAIELLATKIGVVLLALAVTHFAHLKIYWQMYRYTPQLKPTAIPAVIVPEVVAE